MMATPTDPRPQPVADRALREAAQSLLDQFNAYREESGLSHSDAHAYLAQYPLWQRLHEALAGTQDQQPDHSCKAQPVEQSGSPCVEQGSRPVDRGVTVGAAPTQSKQALAVERETMANLIAGTPAHEKDLGPDNTVIGDHVPTLRGDGIGEVPTPIYWAVDRLRSQGFRRSPQQPDPSAAEVREGRPTSVQIERASAAYVAAGAGLFWVEQIREEDKAALREAMRVALAAAGVGEAEGRG